jgi:hypothetical protein
MPRNAPDATLQDQLRCINCGVAAEGTATGWKAYISGGFEDEPLEVAVFCPLCALREVELGRELS